MLRVSSDEDAYEDDDDHHDDDGEERKVEKVEVRLELED